MKTTVISQPFVIRPLDEKCLDTIIEIHQSVLGYSLNSHLGNRHLAFIYRNMAEQNGSYVGVAFSNDKPVGIVSGAIEMEETKSALLRSLTAKYWMNIIAHVIIKPFLIAEWMKSNEINRPVYFEDKEVAAILTAIAVNSEYQGLGIGRHLVEALEHFFIQQGVNNYRLDTLVNNSSAREFYRKLGFHEVCVRADSVLLIKEIERA